MNPILPIILIALGLGACKTSQPPTAATTPAPQQETKVATPEAKAASPEAETPFIIGSWKVQDISDLKLPDPSMSGMVNEVRAKIIADLRMDIRADNTYTIEGFDGINTGRWKLEGDNKLHQMRSDGQVDIITIMDVKADQVTGAMNTGEGVTGKFTFVRTK